MQRLGSRGLDANLFRRNRRKLDLEQRFVAGGRDADLSTVAGDDAAANIQAQRGGFAHWSDTLRRQTLRASGALEPGAVSDLDKNAAGE